MTPDKKPHRTVLPVYFVHINKTGGNSIKTLLALDYRHFTVRQKIREIGREAWDDAFTFTVVRNPFERAVSLWAWRQQKPDHPMHTDEPFKAWAVRIFGNREPGYIDAPQPMEKDGRFMPQTEWLLDDAGEVAVDMVLRFEDLPQTFPCLPHRNKTEHGHWAGYYDRGSREAVGRFFRQDVAKWYPWLV